MAEVVDRNNWIVLPTRLPVEPPAFYETLDVDGYTFARCPDGRFADDKCLASTEDWVFLFEGVLLKSFYSRASS